MSYQKKVFKDIALLKEGGDLSIVSGDFAVAESDQQHIEHLLVSEKGQWRENPVLGVGIMRFLNAPGSKLELVKKARLQLQFDNYKVDRLKVSDSGEMEVQATRIK